MFSQFDYRTALAKVVQLDNTSGTGTVSVGSPDYQADRYDAIFLSQDDVAAHVVALTVAATGGALPIASVSVPAGAGFGGVAPVELVSAAMPAQTPYLLIPEGATLYVNVEVTMPGAKVLNLVGLGGRL